MLDSLLELTLDEDSLLVIAAVEELVIPTVEELRDGEDEL